MRVKISFLLTFISQQIVAAEEKVIASLANEPIGMGNYIQMFFGLFVVVALIFGMAWFMRRMGNMQGMATADLKVLGGISVGQRERIVLVQAGKTQLLVGVAPGEIRTLHVLDEVILAKNEVNLKGSSGFAEKLHAAIIQRKQP